MTKIILVHHGHVEGISPERFRGKADPVLREPQRRVRGLDRRERAEGVSTRPAFKDMIWQGTR